MQNLIFLIFIDIANIESSVCLWSLLYAIAGLSKFFRVKHWLCWKYFWLHFDRISFTLYLRAVWKWGNKTSPGKWLMAMCYEQILNFRVECLCPLLSLCLSYNVVLFSLEIIVSLLPKSEINFLVCTEYTVPKFSYPSRTKWYWYTNSRYPNVL